MGPRVDGWPAYRCSGTLLTSTVVLTAGHCTGEPGQFSGMRVFLESDVQNGDNNYPFAGDNAVEASAWYTHADDTSAAFYQHDVGIIVLEDEVALDAYPTLPDEDELDDMAHARGTKTQTFTAVGYGMQYVSPVAVVAQKVRMYAEPKLNAINAKGVTGDHSLLLSNNASTGGTCFGDSGGPNFIGDSLVVGGVTSFALNGNCAGTGGVFRVDRGDVLDFINEHIDE